MTITEFKEQFDPILDKQFAKRAEIGKILANDDLLKSLLDHAQKLLMSGGKRIRPYVAYLAYLTAGGKESTSVLEFLTALEIFHAFALMHDDVIDRGTERHGIHTLHEFAADLHSEQKQAEHLGEAQAILVGDLLFQWSQEIIHSVDVPAKKRALAQVAFDSMANEVIVGQMIDVDLMTQITPPDKLIETKMKLKTASYSFIRPMQIGFALATTSNNSTLFSEQFGLNIGIAFQIQDDLLDVTSQTETIKKDIYTDIANGQPTLLSNYVFEHGNENERRSLKSHFGRPVNNKDYALIKEMFEQSGAVDFGRRQMNRYFGLARKAIENLPASAKKKHAWYEFLLVVEGRST